MGLKNYKQASFKGNELRNMNNYGDKMLSKKMVAEEMMNRIQRMESEENELLGRLNNTTV